MNRNLIWAAMFMAVLANPSTIWAESAPQTSAEKTFGPVEVGTQPYGSPITHAQIMILVAAAHKEAETRQVRNLATIVVVDPNGEIVYAEKAADARNSHIDIAWAKARSSARYGNPTRAFFDQLQAGNFAQSLALPGAATMGAGGVPIVSQGKIIGAIGVAGARAVNDEAIAKAGISAIAQ